MTTVASIEIYSHTIKCDRNDNKNTLAQCFLLSLHISTCILRSHWHPWHMGKEGIVVPFYRWGHWGIETGSVGCSFGTGTVVLSLPGPGSPRRTGRGSDHLDFSLTPFPTALPQSLESLTTKAVSASTSPPGRKQWCGGSDIFQQGQRSTEPDYRSQNCVDGGELPTGASSWPIKPSESFPFSSEDLKHFLLQFHRNESRWVPPSGSD